MFPSEWPAGIDFDRARRRWPARRSADRLKRTIALLAAKAPTLESFDAAVADFLAECARCSYSSTPPSRRLSIRLIRLYALHFRRVVRQHHYIRAAARWALIGAAG
jgi:hypothetical protein